MDNKQYYVTLPDKTQEGPYDEKALIARYQADKYPEGTLVWCEGMESWESIADIYKAVGTKSFQSHPSPSRLQKRSHSPYLVAWIVSSVLLGSGIGFSIGNLLHQPTEKIVYLEKPILRGTEKQEVELKKSIEQDQHISSNNNSEWDKAISTVEEVTQAYTNERMIQRGKRLLFLLKKMRSGETDINIKHPEFNESMLNLAVRLNLIDIIKLLLEKDIDLEHVERGGLLKTPLADACFEQNIDIVKILLEKGANPNANAAPYRGPLYFAVSKNNAEIVRLLLQYGANPELCRDGQHSLYSMADSSEVRNLIKYHGNKNSIETIKTFKKQSQTIRKKD